MNQTNFATVVTPPGVDGWGTVTVADQTRACYFAPNRFAAPWPVPIAGDRVLVTSNGNSLTALWLIGKGTPTGG